MNIYLMVAIILTNIISLSVVYQFIKKLEKNRIVVFMGISVAVMYFLISIVYWLSGFGIEKNIHEASKDFVVYLFVPINIILIVPYFALKYMKFKRGDIKRDNFAKNVEIIAILLLIILVIEFFYFKNIQNNIVSINENTNKNEIQSSVQNEIQNVIQNENTIKENTALLNEVINDV